MPSEQDFRDSDGDQVLNKDEEQQMGKFVAQTIPLERIEAVLEFYTGLNNVEKHTYELKNQFDLNQYSKNLLVRNLSALKQTDHFSEFSTLTLEQSGQIILPKEEIFKIHLRFRTKKSHPQNLYLYKSGLKTLIAAWKPMMQIELTHQQLAEILGGESFLYLSFDESSEDSVAKKTYRVFINDGAQARAYYISKELTLEEMLSKFSINTFKFIGEENLLTTVIFPSVPEWWVRKFGDNIIVVKEDLKIISEHYFKGFNKFYSEAKRVNGVSGAPFKLSKPLEARALLRITGKRTQVNFHTYDREYRSGSGGKDGDHNQCKDYLRKSLPEKDILFDTIFLSSQMILSHHHVVLREFKHGSEILWELEIPAGFENFTLGLSSLNSKDYVETGLYSSNCAHKKVARQATEGRLELKIEAYIEKI